jgi:hypothetical protein
LTNPGAEFPLDAESFTAQSGRHDPVRANDYEVLVVLAPAGAFLIVRKDQVELSRDEVAKGIATFHPDTAANVQDIGTRPPADVAQRSGQQPGAPLLTSRRGQEESVVA